MPSRNFTVLSVIFIEHKKAIMKTFKHLQFKQHKAIDGAVHAVLNFDNGTYISVVGGGKGNMLYGNGVTSFEVKSTVTDKRNKVSGFLTKNQVTNRMKYLQSIIN